MRTISITCCVFRPAWKKFENHEKVNFLTCVQEVHLRCVNENEEKSLLVSDWEWLPKAGWHPKASFFHDFQMFFIVFDHASTCASMRSLVKIHNNHSLVFLEHEFNYFLDTVLSIIFDLELFRTIFIIPQSFWLLLM